MGDSHWIWWKTVYFNHKVTHLLFNIQIPYYYILCTSCAPEDFKPSPTKKSSCLFLLGAIILRWISPLLVKILFQKTLLYLLICSASSGWIALREEKKIYPLYGLHYLCSRHETANTWWSFPCVSSSLPPRALQTSETHCMHLKGPLHRWLSIFMRFIMEQLCLILVFTRWRLLIFEMWSLSYKRLIIKLR